MRKDGLKVLQQYPVKVIYDGIIVGDFCLDMLVNDLVIVEVKSISTLTNDHMAQAFNYLRATSLPACLLINFGQPKIQVRRLYPSPTWKSSKA
jgi:GxxExxY protein